MGFNSSSWPAQLLVPEATTMTKVGSKSRWHHPGRSLLCAPLSDGRSTPHLIVAACNYIAMLFQSLKQNRPIDNFPSHWEAVVFIAKYDQFCRTIYFLSLSVRQEVKGFSELLLLQHFFWCSHLKKDHHKKMKKLTETTNAVTHTD